MSSNSIIREADRFKIEPTEPSDFPMREAARFRSEKLPLVPGSSALTTAPPGTLPEPLPFSKYTGNYAEEVMSQLMGGVANGIGKLVGAPSQKPPNQGTIGGTIAGVAGEVTGAIPGVMFGAGLINSGLKLATSQLPQAAKSIISLATRLGFTGAAITGAINNSVDFYEALKSGNLEAIQESAAGAIIDSVFSFLMTKGWVDDAKAIRSIYAKQQAARFAAAKNVTPQAPEAPKTLASEAAQAEAAKVAEPVEPTGPSPELETKVDSMEKLAEAAQKLKVSKVKKVETPEELKARMAKVRAARKPKVAPEVAVVPPVEPAKPIQPVITPPTPEERAKAETALTAAMKPVETVKDVERTKIVDSEAIRQRVIDSFGGPEGLLSHYTGERLESTTGYKIRDLSQAGLIERTDEGNWRFTDILTSKFKRVTPEVPSKIDQTITPSPSSEEPVLSPEDIDKLDTLNPDWMDLPNEEIGKLLGRPIEAKPPVPMSEIDTQIGVPEPTSITDVVESPFRQDPEQTKANLANYKRSQSVAKNFSELSVKDPTKPMKDVGPTTWSLITDVNHWLNGGEIDINETRDFLSNLAINADNFRWHFDQFDMPEVESREAFNDWKELVSDAAVWARRVDRKLVQMRSGGPSTKEIVERLKKIHPATYARSIQKAMADIADKLGVSDILDIFGGTGKIGKIKEYGYSGIVRTNEIEPRWGGESTEKISKEQGVDYVNIGDSRNLPNKTNSIQAIFTSPTYGNLMALRSPSKIDSYQALAGGKLREGNTGGEVWGPEYERLHKEVYKEAYRVVKPGGFFVLNMKDKPVTAAEAKNNWIPKKGSTVEVRDGVMRATDWHIRALEEAGFEYVGATRIEEARPASVEQANLRKYTVGYEDIVILRKPTLSYMYSGGPSSEELLKAALNAGKAFKAAMDKARATKKMKAHEVHKETREDLIRMLVERSGNIAKLLSSPEFFEKYGDVGFRIMRNMYLSRGGTPRATNAYRQFEKEVYGGLDNRKSEIVDNLAMAVRMIDIGKYKTEKQFKFPEGQDPLSSAMYLATFAKDEGLTPEEAYELYHEDEKGNIGGRVGAGFAAIRRVLTDMRDEAGGLIGKKEHDDLAAHRYRRLSSTQGPVTLAEVLDKKYEQTIGDIPRNVYDSGVEILQQGRETDILEPSWKLMAFETFTRGYGRLAHNEAGHTLLELAKTHPENPFARTKIRPVGELDKQPIKRTDLMNSVEIKRLENGVSDYELKGMIRNAIKIAKATDPTKTIKSTTKLGKTPVAALKILDTALGEKSKAYTGKGEKIPPGWVPTYVYDKGHRATVWMEPSFAKEWIVNSKDISPRAARMVRWSTLAPITRFFATGIEPGFALANLPRDMMHVWFAAREFENGKWKPVYSPVAPVFSAQFTEDISAVATDTMLRTGWWDDYVKYGGGMDFLTLQGRPFQRGLHIDDSTEAFFKALGYLNESSEIATRLAITRRSLINQASKAGMSLEEARKNPEMMRNAVFAARDYMDFAQGGWAIKLIDQLVPYFNASLVAGRTFARTFKGNMSAQSWWKIGQFALLVAGLYIASKKLAPETSEELKGDIRTQNNIIIPLGDSFAIEDEMGQKRYPFITIPLDASLRGLKKLFEFSVDEMFGNKADMQGTLNAFKQMSPVDVGSMPPLEAAIFEYFANYDTYKMKAIRKEGEVFGWPRSKAEFGPDTPQALIDLGRITGASPERIKVAMSEMISNNSTWAQLLGWQYNKIFSQMPQDSRDQTLTEMLATTPIIRRFIGLTNPYTKFSNTINKENENAAWDTFNQRNGLDILINGYLIKKSSGKVWTINGKFPTTREGIEDYIRSFGDRQVTQRLRDRLTFAEKTKDLPHRTLWMKMEAQSSDARAATYLAEIDNDPKLYQEFRDVNRILERTSRGGLETEGFREAIMKLRRKAEVR